MVTAPVGRRVPLVFEAGWIEYVLFVSTLACLVLPSKTEKSHCGVVMRIKLLALYLVDALVDISMF